LATLEGLEDQLRDLDLWLACLFIFVGGNAIRHLSCNRYLDPRQEKLTKQAALDQELIGKLEDALAELEGTSKPTH
jgi:hypothetical protein